jgi:hypothetical protein
VVSCNRSDDLPIVLAKLFQLIRKSEPDLLYELIWIDRGLANRDSLSRLYQFDKKFLFAKPVGYFVSFRLAFSQCPHKYIFYVEDDWLAMNMSLPWFSFSMDLLAHAPESICAILLCMPSVPRQIYRTSIRSCLVPSGTVWSLAHNFPHFTNVPTVYRVSNLKQISTNFDYANEYEFAARARVMGYTLSFWVDDTTVLGQVPTRFLNIRLSSTKSKRILTCKSKDDD